MSSPKRKRRQTRRTAIAAAGTLAAGAALASTVPALAAAPAAGAAGSAATAGVAAGAAAASRFDKFTEGAKRVLELAVEEAQRFNHNYIGTEHLLLGLARQEESAVGSEGALGTLGVELHKVRRAVEFIIGRGDRIVTGDISLTPRSKRVVQLAIDEAGRLGHREITEQHLLLGLAKEGQGIAAGVLKSLGASTDAVRERVLGVLDDGSSAGDGPTTVPTA